MEWTDFQNAVIAVLHECSRLRLYKDADGNVYRKRVTRNGHDTCVFERHCLFHEFSVTHNLSRKMAHYLLDCQDPEFPTIDISLVDRGVISWEDGILIMDAPIEDGSFKTEFREYSSVDTKHLVSSQYRPHNWMMRDGDGKQQEENKKSALDVYLEAHKCTEADQLWIRGLLGRLLLKPGKHDNWQKAILVSSGFLLEIIGRFFSRDKVLIAGAATIKMEDVINKYLVVASDTLSADTWASLFCSMISHEPRSVYVGRDTEIEMRLETHVVWVGERLPTEWKQVDLAGSISRRFIRIPIVDKPGGVVPKLSEAAMPAVFASCIDAYQQLSSQYGKQAVDEELPVHFRCSQNSLFCS